MANDRYLGYAVDVDGTIIGGISGDSLNLNEQSSQLDGDGSVYPTRVALFRQSPVYSFQTVEVAVALAKLTAIGVAISSGNEFKAYQQKVLHGGTRVTGSNHRLLTVTTGIVIPTSIEAAAGSPAVLRGECHAGYDGSNQPVLVTESSALAAAQAIDEVFHPGPIKINGTLIEGITRIGINFGIQIQKDFNNGAAGQWPDIVFVRRAVGSITFTTHAMDTLVSAGLLTSAGLVGVVQGTTDSLVYLRKMANATGYVADLTADIRRAGQRRQNSSSTLLTLGNVSKRENRSRFPDIRSFLQTVLQCVPERAVLIFKRFRLYGGFLPFTGATKRLNDMDVWLLLRIE